jgi:hypothetical protein
MAQLYAACKQNGPLVVKHVQLAAPLQGIVEGIFQAQDAEFREGVDSEVNFTGDWKPDDDEVLVAHALPEAAILLAAANQNAIALPVLDAANFQGEGVKALFVAVGNGPQIRLLVQSFSPQQILSTKFAMLFDGNTFRRLEEPVFTLGTRLLATIDAAGDVQFKSFNLLRRVFELAAFYQEATDEELTSFCGHDSLTLADAAAFMANADQGIRKSVHAVGKSGVLANFPVVDIQAQAVAIGFPIVVNAGRIAVPQDRKGAKELLSFLLDKVYRGPIHQQLFITNSNRPLA